MRKKVALPDFYNIVLERHIDDTSGYDLVFVDPIARGNFDRLSHSCDPNCATVVTTIDGKYNICVFAIKPIAFGEELTFDYNSVTEDKDEFRRAVCLCSSGICRGSFLYYANSSTFQQVFEQHMTTLVRTANILRACVEPVREEDRRLLKDGRTSLLPETVPGWLRKFAAIVLEFIEYEREELPSKFKPSFLYYNKESAELEADEEEQSRSKPSYHDR